MQMRILLLSLLLLSGCSGLPTMGNGIPSDAIIMGEREEIKINAMSNRTPAGTHIDRFYCTTGAKVCRQYASTKYCTCENELYIPPIMR